MTWKEIVVSGVIGAGSSLAASYAYTALVQESVPAYTVAVGALLIAIAALALSRLSAIANLAWRSDISGYYPGGQHQFEKRLLRDLRRSENVIVVGARGLDLIGPQSALSRALADWSGNITVYLIDPRSHHVRLRSGALDIERQQYVSELNSVVAALRLLSLQAHSAFRIYTYDRSPQIRAIILDRFAYVSFYSPNVQGKKLSTYRVKLARFTSRHALEAYVDYLQATLQPALAPSDLGLPEPSDDSQQRQPEDTNEGTKNS
jgi:hypothetical protein